MYLRHPARRKNGRQHSYWRLVRSVRRDGKVVQETVAHLGELDAEGRANARLLAQQITGSEQQRELFEALPPPLSNGWRSGSIESASSARAGLAGCGWDGVAPIR